MPTLIKGDLDSLRSDVREYYASKVQISGSRKLTIKGVAIKHDGSEYSTDLQKCIEEVETLESDKGVTVGRIPAIVYKADVYSMTCC